jgi:hypothetical protein
MVDQGLDPSATEAPLQAVSVAPQMSKSERLHRWADIVELRDQLDLTEDGALPARHERLPTPTDSSPLTVAFADWAFQAEGLEGRQTRDALAFFDLSEDELQHLVSPLDDGCRTLPAAVVAERIRALADRSEGTKVPYAKVLVTGASVAAVLGLALVAS